MAKRMILNFPSSLPEGVERSVIAETIPRVSDYVLVEDKSYRVIKVLHPVSRRGALDLISQVVVYLDHPQSPTSSERRHLDQILSD